MKSTKNERVYIWEDTQQKCLAGIYKNLKIGKSEKFSKDDKQFDNLALEKKYCMEVKVFNEDVLIVAEILKDLGENNMLVLNLASHTTFGGGVKRGAQAQEEELFRRTNYFTTNVNGFYPLKKMEAVYTPNVTVIKDNNYKDLKKPFEVNMLAVAGIQNPQLENDNTLNTWDYHVTCNAIENIFKISLLKGHDTLILGALGCGAFHNPPEEIVKIFNIYLEKYNGCFKTIVFAVLSRSDENFNIFNTNIKRYNIKT